MNRERFIRIITETKTETVVMIETGRETKTAFFSMKEK
jgi:hypothetical protein